MDTYLRLLPFAIQDISHTQLKPYKANKVVLYYTNRSRINDLE